MDFDSNEEKHFSWYLDELKSRDIITEWQYHPKPFLLSDKVTHTYIKSGKKKSTELQAFLMHPHSYQADFIIYWNAGWEGRFFMCLDSLLSLNYPFITNMSKSGRPYSVIDVKGSFAGPRNNSAITFPLDQKWVYQNYNIYVQKIIPKELFENTFIPGKYLSTDKTNRKRKINHIMRTLTDYIMILNEK